MKVTSTGHTCYLKHWHSVPARRSMQAAHSFPTLHAPSSLLTARSDVQGTRTQGHPFSRTRQQAPQARPRCATGALRQAFAAASLHPSVTPPPQSRYILWICRGCSALRHVGQRLLALTEAFRQASQNTCLRAAAPIASRQRSPAGSPARAPTLTLGRPRGEGRAPAGPARHLHHRLQAYRTLRVRLGERRRRLRRGEGQRQQARALAGGLRARHQHVVLGRALREVHHYVARSCILCAQARQKVSGRGCPGTGTTMS